MKYMVFFFGALRIQVWIYWPVRVFIIECQNNLVRMIKDKNQTLITPSAIDLNELNLYRASCRPKLSFSRDFLFVRLGF